MCTKQGLKMKYWLEDKVKWWLVILKVYFAHLQPWVDPIRFHNFEMDALSYILAFTFTCLPAAYLVLSVAFMLQKSQGTGFFRKLVLLLTPECDHQAIINGVKPPTRLHWMHHLIVPKGIGRRATYRSGLKRHRLKIIWPALERFLMALCWTVLKVKWLNNLSRSWLTYAQEGDLQKFRLFPAVPFPADPKVDLDQPEYLPNSKLQHIKDLKQAKLRERRNQWLMEKGEGFRTARKMAVSSSTGPRSHNLVEQEVEEPIDEDNLSEGSSKGSGNKLDAALLEQLVEISKLKGSEEESDDSSLDLVLDDHEVDADDEDEKESDETDTEELDIDSEDTFPENEYSTASSESEFLQVEPKANTFAERIMRKVQEASRETSIAPLPEDVVPPEAPKEDVEPTWSTCSSCSNSTQNAGSSGSHEGEAVDAPEVHTSTARISRFIARPQPLTAARRAQNHFFLRFQRIKGFLNRGFKKRTHDPKQEITPWF